MSSQQSNSKSWNSYLVALALLAVGIIAWVAPRRSAQILPVSPAPSVVPAAPVPVPPSAVVQPTPVPVPPSLPAPVAPAMDANNVPPMNPLDAMLLPHNPADRKDGVAAAILIDTSGSMADSVKDAAGASSPKIEIARRAVLKLIRQTADFAKAHPEQGVQVGIYEFSARDHEAACREVVPLSSPDPDRAPPLVQAMTPKGFTPIGDAIVTVKQKLDASGFRRLHILVVTDGENNRGYAPADVVAAISRLPEVYRASVYFVAFDVAAVKFRAVRQAGGMVLPAANEAELQQTLDYVLTGKILAEQPPVPGAK